MSNRIYGTRTDINEQEVRDFYNKRAALASSMKNPLSAVVNGEQNPEQADTRSRFDREYIVPRLDLTQNSAVLDIGCGMGRFAEMVLPLCGRYLGADFAPEMIAAAEKRTAAYSDQAKYVCASFSELMNKPDSFFGGKFDCVIMPTSWTAITAQYTEPLKNMSSYTAYSQSRVFILPNRHIFRRR